MSLSQKKIMLIDDEADLTQLIGFQFKSCGFAVETAANGVEALEKVHVFKPDLIILDMNMPRMGGIEFFSKICGPNGRPLYPVLVLTARANIQEVFKDLAIDGFMVKPFEIAQLIQEAELIIRRADQAISKGGVHARIPKVCIVDQDTAMANGLAGLFLNAGRMVMTASSGTAALEKMMIDVPDCAVVYLGLPDVPGDTLILRLSQMAKTMAVKYLLYTARNSEHHRSVMDRIRSKTGVFTLVEYDTPADILKAAS